MPIAASYQAYGWYPRDPRLTTLDGGYPVPLAFGVTRRSFSSISMRSDEVDASTRFDMAMRRRALTSANHDSSRPNPGQGLTFQANLLYPPQSQIAKYEDAVTHRVLQLDAWAQRMGEGFGISFTNFSLNPLQTDFGDGGMALVATMLTALTHRDERVSLERRSGRWGLYFTREPAALVQERRAEAVPLKDAPLDIRERFLSRSEDFIRAYLKLCEDRLGRMKSAVSAADQTLVLLNQLQFT
jgi:hypothetical protein